VVLVPWTAIILIDFWLANRGTTSAASLPEHSSTASSPHIQSQKNAQRCGFCCLRKLQPEDIDYRTQ
jgi:purine-cytosine permease-like protein